MRNPSAAGGGRMPDSFRTLARTGTVLATAAAITMTTGLGPAFAASGVYAEWDLGSGRLTAPGASYLDGTVTSNASRQQTPSGNSTFLNASTPFGKEYGSSQGKNYLFFGTRNNKEHSTATITFDNPTPVGSWGFTLGDIDADKAEITAIGADGKALTAAELGFQSAFNYCNGSPLPSTCKGKTGTDKPHWDAGSSTLVGNGPDTDGASGWFEPKVPIKSLVIHFHWQTGIPIGQLWIAGKRAMYPVRAPAAPAPPPVKGEPQIAMKKTAHPKKVRPGDKVHYTVEVSNKGTADEPNAQFTDDLSDVLDDAKYDDDAKASAGTIDYAKPQLTWRGSVKSGQTRAITYSVTVRHPESGDGKLRNVIIGAGPAMLCQGGKGKGCAPKPVRVPKIYLVHNCRLASAPPSVLGTERRAHC
ncbi:DUF11 domain-containing protein [Actinomadura barringtoniae]|uniref:DUF11 domain-containing protein n=1 Tax=Actinomadura barringtoniae TaxID=1427535 RepID=A0A939T717_9ACTN|nr:DUF11 domain-containing protein [Actinomadura barringtoniae]MBO2455586.1 DUF11 domain-containing protein [Actinomadura barringtoniae]